MDNTNKTVYLGVTVPGIEDIAIAEANAKLADLSIRDILRGKILFSTSCPLAEIMKVRSFVNIYYLIQRFNIGPHKNDLLFFAKKIKKGPLNAIVAYLKKKVNNAKVIVNVSRVGKHTYNRFALAQALLKILTEKYRFTEGTGDNHDYAFRLDIVNHKGLFSLKLSPPSARRYEFKPRTLSPALAHALVWLTQPSANDIFLDPFCGTGTIATERAVYSAQRIIASDQAEVIREHTKKQPPLPAPIELQPWAACKLEIKEPTVTTLVTNLPWGKKVKPSKIYPLYENFFQEAKQIMVPKSNGIVLTNQEKALKKALKNNSLKAKKLYTIDLHGVLPGIYRVGF
jgi:tRNA (guanine6-N2)-methyltransferase